MIQPIERIHPENEKLIAELAESFGWRDEWLQDEELFKKQTEMHAMMTSFAKTQSETLFELMKQKPSIALILWLSRRRRWTKSQTMGMTFCHWAAVFPKEWRKHSDWKSTTKPFLVESTMRGSRFYVVILDAVR